MGEPTGLKLGASPAGVPRPVRHLARSSLVALLGVLALSAVVSGARADPLGAPSMTPPLSANGDPTSVNGGPLGKIFITGQITALALSQSNPSPSPFAGAPSALADLGNAQVEIQTTDGPVQVFLEAGTYALPALGSPYLRSDRTPHDTYGAVPVAYLKVSPLPDVSVQIGALPTLIGAEYTFTFQNMTIERGLLWNQEPATSRGVQVNFSRGPWLVSGSVNDGFYSDRYNWISGLASYAFDASSTLVLDGGANLGRTDASTYATPLAQNNSGLLNLSYTFAKGALLINPYVQYTTVAKAPSLGLGAAATAAAAVLAKWSFTSAFSLAARGEYERQWASNANDSALTPTNLLYGPNSGAGSITVTPTYQQKSFFLRGEVSAVCATTAATGEGFGARGDKKTQSRAMIETGFLL